MTRHPSRVQCVCGDFFLLRAPLLPIDEYLQWKQRDPQPCSPLHVADNRGTTAPGDDERVSQAELRSRLRRIFDEPAPAEALVAASSGVAERLELPAAENSATTAGRLDLALARYLSRITSRPTPYGLFAGCALGAFSDRTDLHLGADAGWYRQTRLDFEYLAALCASVAANPEVRAHLRFQRNSSLYRCGAEWRYAEYRVNADETRAYSLASVEAVPELDAVLRYAEQPRTLAELTQHLLCSNALDPVEEAGPLTVEEVDDYLAQLIESQLLVPELEPTITGADALDSVLALMPTTAELGSQVTATLEAVRARLRASEGRAIGDDVAVYSDVRRMLSALPLPTPSKNLFHVDVYHRAQPTLGKEARRLLERGADVLYRMGGPARYGGDPLSDELAEFAERFEDRYGEAEVPLALALDGENGVGFDGAWAGGQAATSKPKAPPVWGPREAMLFRKIEALLKAGGTTIHLTEADVEACQLPETPQRPESLGLVARLEVQETQARPTVDRVFLKFGLAPGAARLFGRFMHGLPALASEVQNLHEAEAAAAPDGVVYAEVVHLPFGRIGNLVTRPLVRQYEIPLLGCSGAPVQHQIPLDDLRVRVERGVVRLRSARLNLEVRPRLSSAHNAATSKNVHTYRFLYALQSQHMDTLWGWDWGALGNLPFLPRVEHEGVVLSLAMWKLNKVEITSLTSASPDAALIAMTALRAQRELPLLIRMADGDNELFVDTENELSVLAFCAAVRGREHALLMEVFPAPQRAGVSTDAGTHMNEVLVPIRLLASAPAAPSASGSMSHPVLAKNSRDPAELRPSALEGAVVRPEALSDDRVRMPGSEWAYLKLYTGVAIADRLLLQVVQPHLSRWEREQRITQWFFLRYGDPRFHLRLRLRLNDVSDLGYILGELHASLASHFASGAVWRLQVDTYQREFRRYGGDEGILLAEQLFHADSAFALHLLHRLDDRSGKRRWPYLLRSMDTWLQGFGLAPEDRVVFAEETRARFGREFFGRDWKPGSGELAAKYRQQRKRIEAALAHNGSVVPDGETPETWSAAIALLERRAQGSLRTIGRYRELEAAHQLTAPMRSIIDSVIHMHVNRVMRTNPRWHEYLLYDYLARYHQSVLARGRAARGTAALAGV